MGIGAWFAQNILRHLIPVFVGVEMAIGIVGGFSALGLLSAYAWTEYYYPAMILITGIIGILVGMELPLLTRILEHRSGLRRGISEVLTFDYIGALGAALLFPFVLLPYLGHLYTATAIGLLNLFIALIVAWSFRSHLRQWGLGILVVGVLSVVAMITALFFYTDTEALIEKALYEDPVIETQQSTYQKIVLTKRGDDTRLYLNGNLQFSSIDEYRYHEALVHLPAAFTAQMQRALVIGGGDGLAARELLAYDLQEVVVVELDPSVTELSAENPHIATLNNNALRDPRVKVVNQDASPWLQAEGDLFDLIVVDLPDPESEDTAKLYSVSFYKLLQRRLSVGGVMITQATSPWFARRAFWSIGNTMESVFAHVQPATVYVPSFGLWGFFIGAQHSLNEPLQPVHNGALVNESSYQRFLTMPADLPPLETEINHTHSLPIIEYYREGWDALQNASTPKRR